MTTILFIWMVIASDKYQSYSNWHALAEFSSPKACESAALVLGLKPTNFRCVTK
jgi:hypothetical protein